MFGAVPIGAVTSKLHHFLWLNREVVMQAPTLFHLWLCNTPGSGSQLEDFLSPSSSLQLLPKPRNSGQYLKILFIAPT
jgi:hypothetical protein